MTHPYGHGLRPDTEPHSLSCPGFGRCRARRPTHRAESRPIGRCDRMKVASIQSSLPGPASEGPPNPKWAVRSRSRWPQNDCKLSKA